MNLVLYTHPAYLGLRSQALFAGMLSESFRTHGHQVQLRSSGDFVQRRFRGTRLAKWAGYVDQFLIYPWVMRRQMRADRADTLYVFCDQALGPWVPAALHRPHVVHCHDLLALRTALGEWPEQNLAWTGRLYQRFIRSGFRRARHFISISRKTREDLHRVGQVRPESSHVVYNGLHQAFAPLEPAQARSLLAAAGVQLPPQGFVLHVGGGQWYKNALGVVALYSRYVTVAAEARADVAALVLVGPTLGQDAEAALAGVQPPGAVIRLQGLAPLQLQALYSLARAFAFPSLAEGFGWPVAEAMACGCPVVTTAEAPMSEVGGDVPVYLPLLRSRDELQGWSQAAAQSLLGLLRETDDQRQRRVAAGLRRAQRFRASEAIVRYLEIYEQVLLAELRTRTDHARAH